MKMSLSLRKEKWIWLLFAVLVFTCMFVFFDCMHAIVVFDSDDWDYVSYVRPAIPSTRFWNPSRILPEILMPLCGSVALCLYRLTGLGYIESQIFVFAAVLAGFLTAYTVEFSRLMAKRFSLSGGQAALVGALFLLLHFLIFRTAESNNLYLFWSYDASCYFYYTIPAVLNCTLVMFFLRKGLPASFFSAENVVSKAFLVLVLYLAVFSNLFNSFILVAYLSLILLNRVIFAIKKRQTFLDFWKENYFPLFLLLLWLLAVLFEANGGRAGDALSTELRLASVQTSFQNLITDFCSFSLVFLLFAGAILIGIVLFALIPALHPQGEAWISIREDLFLHFFSLLLIALFLVLLCGKVDPAYLLRPQVFFGIAFPMFLILMTLGCSLLQRLPALTLGLPLMLLVLFSLTNTQEVTFAESNTMGIPWQQCVEINNDLIDQIISIDRSGAESATLEVMDTGYDDNWPHTAFMVYGFQQTMKKHGFIQRDFELSVHWSTEFNAKHGLSIDEFSEARFYN